ncbi:DUF2442 domain-containing protein [Sulfurivirga sp.]|uniref:DUF2442 domain-containing protein n=1 Tax=Sulfurivirga sp. TaxID=2614236 RepID=UPI0025EAC563|nr:DUF2442 domain-containing protein [Sulfurivirga sp.]
MPGVTTSPAHVEQVANPSQHGVWLLIGTKEFFLPYESFPWFKGRSAEELEFEQPIPGHFYWPRLDVDLTLDMIAHPDAYPLTAQQ